MVETSGTGTVEVQAQDDPRRTIDAAPMSRAQVAAIVVTGMISALDGFDVLSATFAAPGIVKEFGIASAALGAVLAMGLVGMAAGSLFLGPLADTLGRRRVVMISLGLMAAGMFASAYAASISALAFWRVVTGCGIGAMVAVITPLAAEYANHRRRELAVAIMSIGYPIGGVVGGTIAALLMQVFDWRAVFLLGAGGAVLLFPLVWLFLPESLAYLIDRRPPDALGRVNAILARFGHSPVRDLPPAVVIKSSFRPAILFQGALLRTTITIMAVNFLYVIAAYYFLSWLPQLVAQAGYDPATATGVSVAANICGIAGGALLGWVAPRIGLKVAVAGALFGLGIFMALFGIVPPDLALLRLTAGITGFFLFAAVVGVYSVIALSFPAHVRATGAGFVIGVGRGGSALAPIVAGLLSAAGLDRGSVSLLIGLCAIAAGAGIFLLPAVNGGSAARDR